MSITTSLPHPTASPADVRTFFTTILTNHHGLSDAAARDLVAPWTLGRGAEMQYYSLETYRAMFGAEAGDLLFGYARGKVRGDVRGVLGKIGSVGIEKKEKDGEEVDLFGGKPKNTLLIILGSVTILLGIWAKTCESRGMAVATSITAVFSFLAFMIAYCLIYFK